MLFKCNYNVKDLQITSTFYSELLKWWSERLREDNDWHYVIWNNRDFRTDDKPFFYHWYLGNRRLTFWSQRYGILRTDRKNVTKTNFLEWTSMKHSIPTNLKVLNRSDSSTFNAIPSFKINGGVFDIAKKKSKDYYPFLIKKKACLPNYTQKWKKVLRKAFLLPHSIAFEPYVKPFNLKYSILYFLPTQSCLRLGTGQTTCALFAKGNQKL